MKRLILPVFAIFLATLCIKAQGSDVANNSAYNPSWDNGDNGGTGFNTWALTTSGGGFKGHFIGDASAQGFGDMNTDFKDFGMYANSASDARSEATRTFTELANNQKFSIDLAIAYRNGSKGIQIKDGSTVHYTFAVESDQYKVDGTSLGWSYSQTSIFNLVVEQVSATSIKVTLKRGSDTDVKTITTSGRIDGFTLFIQGTGNNNLDNLYSNNLAISAVLPVELTFFKILPVIHNVNLAWSTATELNNSHFDIERSADSRRWTAIGTVAGHGTTLEQQDYTYTDRQPLQGINYYRLKQVDYDGNYEYSKVISVDFRNGNRPPVLYPNPTGDELFVSLQEEPDSPVTAAVYDISGRLWQQAAFTGNSLDLSGLPSGVYFVKLTDQERFILLQERLVKR